MKKQYEGIWFSSDGNRHTLYPLYAESLDEAKAQVEDFIIYSKKEDYTDIKSIKIR